MSPGFESEYFELHVTLEVAGCKLKPKEDVYNNLKEIWNIESTCAEFLILGRETDRYWREAQDKIIDVFSSTVRVPDKRNRTHTPSDLGKNDYEEGERHRPSRRRKESEVPRELERAGRRKDQSKDRYRSKKEGGRPGHRSK